MLELDLLPDLPAATEIGVFDSGVGGLSVLRELHALLPDVGLHYVADAAYAPYGQRSPDEIRQRSEQIAAHLIEAGAKLIVVACNTATAHAIEALRARWPRVPFVGTEPGIKPAVSATRNGRIGVLATAATAASSRYQALVARHGQGAEVFTQACPGVVDLIEAGQLDAPELRALVARYTAPLREAQVDTVLLGCTHYPFIEALWHEALGPEIQLLRIETAVARRAAGLWRHEHPQDHTHTLPQAPLLVETSGNAEALGQWMARVLGWGQVEVRHWAP